MANYASSVFLAAITNLNARLQSAELRPPVDQVIEAFMTQREVSIPNLTELRTSAIRATKVNYLKRTTDSVGSARSCTPSASLGDSGQNTLTWTTYTRNVYLPHKPMNNNYYSQMAAFENDIYNALLDLRASITTAMIAYLEANKTTVNDGSLGTWDAVTSVQDYAYADLANFFNYMKSDMFENDYNQNLLNIHSISQTGLMKYPFSPGLADGNTTLQYQQQLQYSYPGYSFYPAHITNASDAYCTNYNVYEGGIAVLDWIPPLNRDGKDIGVHVWETMTPDPSLIPWPLAVHITRDCADTTSIGGDVQDLVDTYELSVDLSLTHAPLTAAGETVIFKNQLQSS